MTSTKQIDAVTSSRTGTNTLWRLMMVAFLGVILTSAFCGCGSGGDKQSYDAGYNGQTITLRRGDPMKLMMIVNIQTGAKWQIVELNQDIVALHGEPKVMGNIVSGGLARIYSYNYKFQAKNAGTTTLKMNLVKPGDAEPLDTFSVTLVVQN